MTATPLTEREMADRNLDLIGTHLHAALDDPALLHDIPQGAHLILLPEDDPALAEANRAIGWRQVLAGHDVYFRHVPRLVGRR